MAVEQHSFEAEVSRLLDIVAHSLYSNKEIFLRELISNASDACDKLRYLALTDSNLSDGDYRVLLTADSDSRKLTVTDNGIGMNHDELVENLGTIARSGTAAFLRETQDGGGSGDGDTATSDQGRQLIGQFGVGFYSVFMVADSVTVVTRRAGETQSWQWTSDGKGTYAIEPSEEELRGTRVEVTLKEEEKEYLERHRLENIVKTYSDHIAIPVVFESKGEAGEIKVDTLNAASALWARPKSDITAEQYKEFYHHVAHAYDDPWLTVHWQAEGLIEYTSLLFIPASRPYDLFDPERKNRVKLYVRRVFITDEAKDLLPGWLRFVRGVIDTPDLPLNVSRELLQNNPLLAKIRSGVVKRILSELEKKADKEDDAYNSFWETFGAVMKEGLYEFSDQREQILKLARFRSTKAEGWTSLADYKSRMKDGQESIYYIAGDSVETLTESPQLEGFKARDVEVLLLTDPVDEFWIPMASGISTDKFQSVTRGGAELDKVADADAEKAKDEGEEKDKDTPEKADSGAIDSLIAMMKLTLGDDVKDVRSSTRLTDSPVCLVADDDDVDMHLERMLRKHQQLDGSAAKRILEINPGHRVVTGLAALIGQEDAKTVVEDGTRLLLDQALITEGEPLPNPKAFTRRLAAMMERGLAA